MANFTIPARNAGETDKDYNVRLMALLQTAKATIEAGKGKITIKTSEKRAVSVYGLGRWPTTLYKSQWLALFAAVPQIKAYIETHDGELAEKGE